MWFDKHKELSDFTCCDGSDTQKKYNVTENTELIIFNSKYVRRILEIVGITLKFEIKWKQIG